MSLLMANRGLIRFPPEKFLVTMDMSTPSTAGINLTFASGSLMMDWKEGGGKVPFVSGVELTHTYTTPGIYIGELSGSLENITKFIADNSKITQITNLKTGLLTDFNINSNLYSGILDMSQAPVSGAFRPYSNTGLTGIIFATSGNGVVNDMIIRFTAITSLDLSNVPISTAIEIRNNPVLTNITFSSSGNSKVTAFRLYTNNLTGVLDLSNVPIGTFFNIYSNPLLTGITHSTIGNTITTSYLAYSCNLTGTLVLTNVPISGAFQVRSNALLTSIIHSLTGNSAVATYYAYSCNLTGVLDLSNVPIAGNVICRFNALLTNILFSTTGNGAAVLFDNDNCALTNLDYSNFTSSTPTLEHQNNGMSATEHDNQLININATGWINGGLKIIIGNTARTAASDAAFNNMVLNGWLIT